MTFSSDPRSPAPLPPSEPLPSPGPPSAPPFRASNQLSRLNQSASLQLLLGSLLMLAGLVGRWPWLTLTASLLTFAVALKQLLPPLWRQLSGRLDDGPTARVLAAAGLLLVAIAVPLALGWLDPFLEIYRSRNWEAIGAIGQILVALVALAIAWRQVMVDQRLTTQQNRITQAQTIDSFIHGISEMIIDEEGLLEDWPLERMLAEGRLAAVLSSIDREGQARILRFLAHARLLTPLRRDHRLGRAILDGEGNYEEDRLNGVPVIRLNRMLKGMDLSETDLRGVDFNGADLRGASFVGADLREANFAGANLGGANFEGARVDGARFFYGRPNSATPLGSIGPVDHESGNGTGAIVENANFAGARHLDPQAHHYIASWSGPRSRATLPGGSRGIPSQLERLPPA
jgi:uncharacterized protein YjbI with pentapeptide repeats